MGFSGCQALLCWPFGSASWHCGRRARRPCPCQLGLSAKREGYLARAVHPGNFSAVTGACQMVRRDVYERVEGCDEKFAVGFNDADFCLRVWGLPHHLYTLC